MYEIKKWLLKIHESSMMLLLKLITKILVLDIVSIIILIVDYFDVISEWHTWFSTEEYFFFWVLILQFIMIIFIFLQWTHKYYIFEENKVTSYNGIFFKKKQEFNLDKIGSLIFEQWFLGKIFNYGNIIIFTQNRKFILKWLISPEEITKLLKN